MSIITISCLLLLYMCSLNWPLAWIFNIVQWCFQRNSQLTCRFNKIWVVWIQNSHSGNIIILRNELASIMKGTYAYIWCAQWCMGDEQEDHHEGVTLVCRDDNYESRSVENAIFWKAVAPALDGSIWDEITCEWGAVPCNQMQRGINGNGVRR